MSPNTAKGKGENKSNRYLYKPREKGDKRGKSNETEWMREEREMREKEKEDGKIERVPTERKLTVPNRKNIFAATQCVPPVITTMEILSLQIWTTLYHCLHDLMTLFTGYA